MAILFEEDWNRYPTAIIDVDTRNESFLRICKLYETMGIKNAYFPLALINPMLVGVDPFAEDLTQEQMTMIAVEIRVNPWYYLREVLRAPSNAGETPVQLEANRANIALWWSWLNHVDFYLIQPRQTGKSLNSDGITTWYIHFGTRNSRANLFTKDHELIKENINRLKKMRTLLPKFLINLQPSDTDNQTEITYKVFGNRLGTKQAQANEDSALNVGRGLTAPYNHIDEIAFLRFNWISVGAMLGASGAAREEAAKNNLPYGNIFTTTAGDLSTPHGKYAHRILKEGAEWTELFFDCKNTAELMLLIRKRCSDPDAMLINGTFSHRQLGKSDQWLRGRIAESRQKGDAARRDFMNVWTLGGENNPIPKELLEKIRENSREPDYVEIFKSEGYMFRWYVPKEEVEAGLRNRTLVMGLDTSEAINRDNMSVVILDVSTMEVVGACSVAETNLHQYAIWLAKFLIRHPTIVLVGEDKTAWKSILGYLLMELPSRGQDPGRRIYSAIVDNKDSSESDLRTYRNYVSESGTNHYNRFIRYFGFKTTASSRELLFGNLLLDAVKKTAHVIRDGVIRDELGSLREGKGGRVDHSNDSHDDSTVAWLLCHWFLTYAKNLSHYGIDRGIVKRKLLESGLKLDWRQQRLRDEQEQIRADIEGMIEELRNPYLDMVLKARLQHRLESVYNRIDHEVLGSDAVGSIDALREELDVKETIRYNQRAMAAGTTMADSHEGGMRRRRHNLNEIVEYA